MRPDYAPIQTGDTVYSVCHNCMIEETMPGATVKSLWKLILSDETFVFPDYNQLQVTLQDCWLSRKWSSEQDAVRSLLLKMNICYIEAKDNRQNTDLCGNSLYKPHPYEIPN